MKGAEKVKKLVCIFIILISLLLSTVTLAVDVPPEKLEILKCGNIEAFREKFDFELTKDEIRGSKYIVYEELYTVNYVETNNNFHFRTINLDKLINESSVFTDAEINQIENSKFRNAVRQIRNIKTREGLLQLINDNNGFELILKEVKKRKIQFPYIKVYHEYREFPVVLWEDHPDDVSDMIEIKVIEGNFNEDISKFIGNHYYSYFDNIDYDGGVSYNNLQLLRRDKVSEGQEQDFYEYAFDKPISELYESNENPYIGLWDVLDTKYEAETYFCNFKDGRIRNDNSYFWDGEIHILCYDQDNNGLITGGGTSGGVGDPLTGGDGLGGSATSALLVALLAGLGVFFTQNLNGALAGLGSGGNGDNVDGESSEEKGENNSNLILDSSIENTHIVAGDSEKSIVLWARVYARPDEEGVIDAEAANKAMKKIDVYPQGRAKEYVYIEKEKEMYWDGWRRFYISFTYASDSKFYKGDSGLSFPLRVPLAVYAGGVTNPTDTVEYITIEKPEPSLIIEPKSIIMAQDSTKHQPIEVRVNTFEEGEWEFKAEIEESESAINDYKVEKVGVKKCRVYIKSERLEGGIGTSITNNLIIKARNSKSKTITTGKLTVSVVKEGLSIVSGKPLNIYADSKREAEIKITAATAIHGRTVTDYDLLENIEFSNEIKADNEVSRNALETAALQFEKVGWENVSAFGEEKISAYIYKVKTKNVVPGRGKTHHGQISIKSTKGGETYSVIIPMNLDTASIAYKSEIWREELDRCRKVVYLLPEVYQQKMLDIVNSKAAKLLGYEGLYELRHRVWKIGQTLWQAEGLSGYEDVERWSGYIETTLNWTKWFGEIAADAAVTALSGNPFMGIIGGKIHTTITSSLVAYRNGTSLQTWYESEFAGDFGILMNTLEDMGAELFDPERVEKLLSKLMGKNPRTKAIAYLMLFTYYYVINVERYGMGVIKAIKEAAKMLVYEEVLKYVGGKIIAHSSKKISRRTAKKMSRDAAQKAAKKTSKKTVKKVGKTKVDDIPNKKNIKVDDTPKVGKKNIDKSTKVDTKKKPKTEKPKDIDKGKKVETEEKPKTEKPKDVNKGKKVGTEGKLETEKPKDINKSKTSKVKNKPKAKKIKNSKVDVDDKPEVEKPKDVDKSSKVNTEQKPELEKLKDIDKIKKVKTNNEPQTKKSKDLDKNKKIDIEDKTKTEKLPTFEEEGFKKGKKKIKNLEDAIKKGDKDAIRKSMLEIKTDKYAIAEINKKVDNKGIYSDDLKQVINDEFDDMVKKPINEKLNKKIGDFMKNKKGVKEIISIEDTGKSNPSEEIKVGSDWDVGKKVSYIDKYGKQKTMIMKQKDLKPLVTESVDETLRDRFGKDVSPEELRKKMDIEAMGNDAAGGYAKDLDKAVDENIGIKDNVEKYMNESIDIKDPEAFSKTAKYKIQEWWNERATELKNRGATPTEIKEAKLEGLKQFHKQHKSLLEPMSKIAKVKNPELKQPPKVLKDFHELSGRVIRGETKFKDMENILNKKGYTADEIFEIFGDYIEVYAKEL